MINKLRVISLGNTLRRIIRLWLGTMNIISRNWVVEISLRFSKSFQLHPLRQLVFHPPRIEMTGRMEHQDLSVREVFQAPSLTPLALSVVRWILASFSHERKVFLGAVSLVIGWGIILLDKVKKVLMVELSQQLHQHQQVTRFSRVTHLVQVAVGSRTCCILLSLARMRKVLLI